MAVFTSLLAALGTAASAAGSAASTIGGIAGAVGTAAGIAGTIAQVSGANKAAGAQKTAERLREAQMNMESDRAKRSAVRQAMVARATALSNANSQGAQDGSGLAGGTSQITAQEGNNLVGVNAGQQIGAGLFAANRQEAAGNTMSSFGSGLSSLGGALVKNQDAIGRVLA